MWRLFIQCVVDARRGILIQRESRTDKEYHFQNWVRDRIAATRVHFDAGGRNSYPDFSLVDAPEGFEVKGLAYPGRDASFDSNSQVPSGLHNGRTIYYVFGRYPAEPDGDTYPVLDLVVCHGDFLNADHEYVHENKSVKAFGSYGDILIRDRKMYVVPTPFHLVEGTVHQRTLILPASFKPPSGSFVEVGSLTRVESPELVVGYGFDLRTNVLAAKTIPNPNAGAAHAFRAWRKKGDGTNPVLLAAHLGPAGE